MADTSVFTRLKRLFSTDVIIKNVGGNQLKVLDFNQNQVAGQVNTNSLYDRYTRLHTTNASPIYNPGLNYQTLRVQLYSDYEAMDTDAIIASALDIVADECTLKNEMGEVLSIKSPDENIQKILYNLYYDILNIEFNLWMWTRQMCKYGDFFLKLEVAENYGVYNVIPYTAYNVIREEGFDENNKDKVQFRFDPDGLSGGGTFGGYFGGLVGPNGSSSSGAHTVIFDNYEIAHFRLISDVSYLPYGRSYVEPARKLFKQYTLLEDAMLIHRIVRAPEKRIFYINIGQIPPAEVDAFMQKTVSKMKRTPYVDQKTGDYNLKYNMQNMLEDFYIPMRGNDQTTKIDTTPGLTYDGIQDVEYLRDKLFAALKIPRAFMGYDETTEGKATLAAQDIRFARTIDRIQRILISELYKIGIVHLYTQGYDGEALTNFELDMTTPSIIYDQERVALMKEKVELANSVLENKLMPSDWVYDHLFHLSEDEYAEYRDLIREDMKRKFRLTQIENEGNDPLESGESYGTPHDLATLYGKGRYNENPGGVPAGYDEESDLGRPKEKVSTIGTQNNPFGKDRLGVNRMKDTDNNDSNSIRPSFKGGSPLALEAKAVYYQNREALKNIPIAKKKLIFEQDKQKESLLDERNIKE